MEQLRSRTAETFDSASARECRRNPAYIRWALERFNKLNPRLGLRRGPLAVFSVAPEFVRHLIVGHGIFRAALRRLSAPRKIPAVLHADLDDAALDQHGLKISALASLLVEFRVHVKAHALHHVLNVRALHDAIGELAQTRFAFQQEDAHGELHAELRFQAGGWMVAKERGEVAAVPADFDSFNILGGDV